MTLSSATRFRTHAVAPAADGRVPLGFLFGPRALRRTLGRELPVPVATGIGRQRTETRRFASAGALAGFLVEQWNASLARAGLPMCLDAAHVACLDDDETVPAGVSADVLLDDLTHGRTGTLPVECWAARKAVAAVLLLLDWERDRAALERGAWTGRALWSACERDHGGIVFAPAAVIDVTCALTTHAAGHEFGHLLGCMHEDTTNPLAPAARGFVADESLFTVMAAARGNDAGRRLEWSRPSATGGAWEFGDPGHDEVAWLRVALPALARQRFRCTGACGGACRAPAATPAALQVRQDAD